jgi:hypothetical protein
MVELKLGRASLVAVWVCRFDGLAFAQEQSSRKFIIGSVLSGEQPAFPDLLPVSSRSRMTRSGLGLVFGTKASDALVGADACSAAGQSI